MTFGALRLGSQVFAQPQLPLGRAEISTGHAMSVGGRKIAGVVACLVGGSGGFDVGSDSQSLAHAREGPLLHHATSAVFFCRGQTDA